MRRGELADAAEQYIRSAVIAGAPLEAAAALESEDFLAPIVDKARERFLGVGAEQYQISETEQSFERSTVGTMLVGKIEEVVDDLNYSTMIDILIERRLADLAEERTESSLMVASALRELRDDLREAAYLAATSAALMLRHIDRLVAIGEYERRGEADYVSQLAAECDEAGAPMRGEIRFRERYDGLEAIVAEMDAREESIRAGASGRSGAEIEAHYNGRGDATATDDLDDFIDERLRAGRVERERQYVGAAAPLDPETPEGLDAIAAAWAREESEFLAQWNDGGSDE
jgi:hypothetical protein